MSVKNINESHPMIVFGKENTEISMMPFLVKMIEEEDNVVKFIVALSVQGEKGTGVNDIVIPEMNKLLHETTPIYPDESNMYEILFENYIFHMTRNESYASWNDYEIRNGNYFIIFDKSRLLDYLPQIIESEIVDACHSNGWRHYGIYCQNHIIDVITAEEPKIKKIH